MALCGTLFFSTIKGITYCTIVTLFLSRGRTASVIQDHVALPTPGSCAGHRVARLMTTLLIVRIIVLVYFTLSKAEITIPKSFLRNVLICFICYYVNEFSVAQYLVNSIYQIKNSFLLVLLIVEFLGSNFRARKTSFLLFIIGMIINCAIWVGFETKIVYSSAS